MRNRKVPAALRNICKSERLPDRGNTGGVRVCRIQRLVYQFYDRPGYTIEAGLGENPLPMEQFSKIYKDNVGILLGGMTELE